MDMFVAGMSVSCVVRRRSLWNRNLESPYGFFSRWEKEMGAPGEVAMPLTT